MEDGTEEDFGEESGGTGWSEFLDDGEAMGEPEVGEDTADDNAESEEAEFGCGDVGSDDEDESALVEWFVGMDEGGGEVDFGGVWTTAEHVVDMILNEDPKRYFWMKTARNGPNCTLFWPDSTVKQSDRLFKLNPNPTESLHERSRI